MFRRRFRMSRNVFLRIVDEIKGHDMYFEQRADAVGRFGLSIVQKIIVVFRMLAYGLPADATDEYVKIGESIAIESMKRFCRAVVEVFGDQYLRSPTTNGVASLLYIDEQRGFPANGIAPPARYVIQGKEYDIDYYLADGIYPKWSIIVQTIREPRSSNKRYFAMKQESCRKDIERAFGVLQSCFAIVAGPSRFWRKEVLRDIITTCIILHNMIIEDGRDFNAPIENARECPAPTVEMTVDENHRFE
uniref:Uncharacterized protein LOC104223143 n=1 Tax=Nicotiana sylvestris TaxID=4096 RepID=A0A1U7WF08_NICSY|nr:PREDICTED: uncharacterized protein LOC104223143 [Nicotiana sylvestris]